MLPDQTGLGLTLELVGLRRILVGFGRRWLETERLPSGSFISRPLDPEMLGKRQQTGPRVTARRLQLVPVTGAQNLQSPAQTKPKLSLFPVLLSSPLALHNKQLVMILGLC